MSITSALRKLSKEDAEEVRSLMADLRDNDGMEQKDAAEYALRMVMDEARTNQNDLIIKMGGKNGN